MSIPSIPPIVATKIKKKSRNRKENIPQYYQRAAHMLIRRRILPVSSDLWPWWVAKWYIKEGAGVGLPEDSRSVTSCVDMFDLSAMLGIYWTSLRESNRMILFDVAVQKNTINNNKRNAFYFCPLAFLEIISTDKLWNIRILDRNLGTSDFVPAHWSKPFPFVSYHPFPTLWAEEWSHIKQHVSRPRH